MSHPLTIHMIGNAHLDPVWRWTWQAGVDEAVATCRTACDLLDAYPGLYITRGEAWVHAWVRDLAPALFKRIQKHAAAGRWQVVNGWWIQPDCNLPDAVSFRKQGEFGKGWFREHLGVDVTVGYNVDSFGHAATLPTFLREAGMDSYVFMRPGPHEKELPADLFTWRSPLGDEVTACRINDPYCPHNVEALARSVERVCRNADRSVGHAMCFFGVGNHGGGPTAAQVEWILANRHYGDGAEIILSHPAAFFKAAAAAGAELPVVDEELQYHAVGCYSIVHACKQEMRKAEELADRAGNLAEQYPGHTPAGTDTQLETVWQRILFNQFHDIHAGSSIEAAYEHCRDELGQAKVLARDIITRITRSAALAEPADTDQRLVIFNPGARPYRGLAMVEPWIRADLHGRPVTFAAADGSLVPSQITAGRSATDLPAYLVPVDMPAGGCRTVHVRHAALPAAVTALKAADGGLQNGIAMVKGTAAGLEFSGPGGVKEAGISVAVIEDLTDTWSHGVPGFSGRELGRFTAAGSWRVIDTGPLRARMINAFAFEESRLTWLAWLDHDSPVLRMQLRLNWSGVHRAVKLILPPPFSVTSRRDAVPGAVISRPLNGQEYPLNGIVTVDGTEGCLAVLSRDIFAADVQADGAIRATLLRSTPYAHHDPFVLQAPHPYALTDQGEHIYDIAVTAAPAFDSEKLQDLLFSLTNPLEVCEITHGMPRFGEMT